MTEGKSDTMNLTVTALVALVAIVGLVALVMNAGGRQASPVSVGGVGENVAGNALAKALPQCATLREGETMLFTIKGYDYETTLVFVSEPPMNVTPEAKFSINGALTPALRAGGSYKATGIKLMVTSILADSREGVVSFCVQES
jgi:hypothetical protein